jgi:hypothetical protein
MHNGNNLHNHACSSSSIAIPANLTNILQGAAVDAKADL